jgi:hypothetical protein
MPRSLEIFNREDWFLRESTKNDGSPGYCIYYRFAITYSIAKYVTTLSTNFSYDMAEVEVKNLLNTVNSNELYYDAFFLELYSLGDNQGYVVVDQTDSYYPLIFYGENNQRDGKERIKPLKYSLQDIEDVFEDIWQKISTLKTMDDWSYKFQQELYKLYPNKP